HNGTFAAVIGGYVYRGKQIPGLRGIYLFGDYSLKKIFKLNYDGTTASNVAEITGQLFPTATNDSLSGPSSFGEDANGEVYITDVVSGMVFKIVPTTPNVELDSVATMGNGFVLQGNGLPFKSHTVQAVASMTQPFNSQANIGTASAGGDGGFQ